LIVTFKCFRLPHDIGSKETSEEGIIMLSSTELRLQNPKPLYMGPNFNLIHEINPESDLGRILNGKDKRIRDFIVVVRLIAYSTRFQSDVATSKFYHASDLLVGHKYGSF